MLPRVIPSTEMNSVTISPTPPSSLINRRKDESVTPAIGASAKFGVIVTFPILISFVILKQQIVARLACRGNHGQEQRQGTIGFSRVVLQLQPTNRASQIVPWSRGAWTQVEV